MAERSVKSGILDQGGWTLVESLVSLSLLALMLTPALALVSSLQAQYQADRGGSEARDNGRVAMAVASRFIGSAGNNPHGVGVHAWHSDDPATMAIEADLTGAPDGLPDGVLDDSFERVTLQWDPSEKQLTLASGDGNRQPVARCIALLDVAGLAGDGSPTDEDDAVRYVQVRVVAQSELPDVRTQQFQRVDQTLWVPILSRLRYTP